MRNADADAKAQPSPTTQRAELRRRLRQKIRCGRNAPVARQSSERIAGALRSDPAGALLSMGVDDPTILQNAKAITSNPHALMKQLKAGNTPVGTEANGDDGDEDDEELPPA